MQDSDALHHRGARRFLQQRVDAGREIADRRANVSRDETIVAASSSSTPMTSLGTGLRTIFMISCCLPAPQLSSRSEPFRSCYDSKKNKRPLRRGRQGRRGRSKVCFLASGCTKRGIVCREAIQQEQNAIVPLWLDADLPNICCPQ